MGNCTIWLASILNKIHYYKNRLRHNKGIIFAPPSPWALQSPHIFSIFAIIWLFLISMVVIMQLSQARRRAAATAATSKSFPMQPHRRSFVSSLGFEGPRSRAVLPSTDSTMGLYAAKASLPHLIPSSPPSSGAQGFIGGTKAPKRQHFFECSEQSNRPG